MSEGVSLQSILAQAVPMASPPPMQSTPTHASGRVRRVRFEDEGDEEAHHPPPAKSYLGGIVDKNNYYMIMLESLKPAFIAGLIAALFQVDFVKSFIVSNISGVMSPNLSVYGFFVFVAIGAVAFKLGEIAMTSRPSAE